MRAFFLFILLIAEFVSFTAAAITYAGIKNILQKNTCLAFYHPTKRQVGPSYEDVAKRKCTVS